MPFSHATSLCDIRSSLFLLSSLHPRNIQLEAVEGITARAKWKASLKLIWQDAAVAFELSN